ncbi:hypothetical protein COL5a_009854 [Colletotrichum fioriniae]|uniref:uncharacterized protein n=1 Tax=Colletotrichum fioriniae TaxID=710243 RepID=UPI002300134C|nr:uncharacterized protein COL516b_010604 [Colletotrichum fioriniae]KAJ0297557.1 hypothetical protein COL516b_010604 [Colletotrichum fioriniae]KAJ0320223.1 hypothetical protein COL5a_009854 [Colletotrichum fioriniae]KAJ3940043.1 hypothetical protein N0V96_010041 [Colletotrichum fioriniae]
MRYTNLLLLATTAGTMAAGLENRGLLACVDAVKEHRSVTTDLPTLSATGVDKDDIPTITNACELPTLTGAPGSILTSFTSEVKSWTSAHSSELGAVWSACKDEDFVGKITSLAESYGPVCSAVVDFSRALDGTTMIATTTAAGTAATETGAAATGTGGAATAGTSAPNAAPRETGMVMVAVAAAGVAFAAMN